MHNNDQITALLYNFVEGNKSICEDAYNNNWLGYYIDRNTDGLLGYMRYSYRKQIKTLNGNDLPIPFPFLGTPDSLEIYSFFNSNYFVKEVKRNGKPTEFYKKDHFKILEKIGKTRRPPMTTETPYKEGDRILSFENWVKSIEKYHRNSFEEIF